MLQSFGIASSLVRVSFGLSLLLSVSPMNAMLWAMQQTQCIWTPIRWLTQGRLHRWGYVPPSVLIVGGVALTLGIFKKLRFGQQDLLSHPFLQRALEVCRLRVPLATNAPGNECIIWILVFAYVVKEYEDVRIRLRLLRFLRSFVEKSYDGL